jgi:dTDP-4-amino-4,6-dideoxygalactose transaminase
LSSEPSSERPLRLAEPVFGEGAVAALKEVLASGRLTQGPNVARFERLIAAYCGAAHGVATTSATTALELSLMALGIGPGDEVLVPDFTYPATANAALRLGASVRLVDVEPGSWCVDPEALAAAAGPATAALVSVDVFGLPADYEAIEPLAAKLGLPLVCDAACSLGGAQGDRRCGVFGAASCFSFHPRKSLTTGEGGMVTTEDQALAERMRLLRNHGGEADGWKARFVEAGANFRMSELQAALGALQVEGFEAVVESRRRFAAELSAGLSALDGITPQLEPEGRRHPYQSYVAILDDDRDRDGLVEFLRGQGVESTLGTYALHAEPAFMRACGTEPGNLPNSWRACRQTIALPAHQRLELTDAERIVAAVREGLSRGSR